MYFSQKFSYPSSEPLGEPCTRGHRRCSIILSKPELVEIRYVYIHVLKLIAELGNERTKVPIGELH